MTDDPRPFEECADLFAQHKYRECATLAVNLLTRHMYHWLSQLLLISLERSGQFSALAAFRTEFAKDFSIHEWESHLISLTSNTTSYDELCQRATDDKKRCQLLYYEGSRRLTRGDREAAMECFAQCSSIPTQCMESLLAASEILAPEPVGLTLERLLVAAAHSAEQKDTPESLQYAGAVVRLAQRNVSDSTLPIGRSLCLLAAVLTTLPESPGRAALLRETAAEMASIGYQSQTPSPACITELGTSVVFALRAPLTRFTGALKQIRTADLSPLARAAILLGFPLFLGRPKGWAPPEHPAISELRKRGYPGDEGSPYCRRRYSGDASEAFGRSRYYSLCSDPNGDDDATLVSELNAYAAPLIIGYCNARQTSDPSIIEVVLRGLPYDANPLAQAIKDPSRHEAFLQQFPDQASDLVTLLRSKEVAGVVSDSNELVIQIKCSVATFDIDHCIDLRTADARRWTLNFFRKPPQGLFGKSLVILAKAHEFDIRSIATWADLLPAVNAKTYGGNPLTDLYGVFLRNIGVAALIYPSARNDYSAALENGALKRHAGWNLVDYRGADATGHVAIDIGNPISKDMAGYELSESLDGATAGSIALRGNKHHTRVENELTFQEHLFLHGAEWRLRHHAPELSTRGYFWYRTTYTVEGPIDRLTCDCCGDSIEKGLLLSPNCPKCGYTGDP